MQVVELNDLYRDIYFVAYVVLMVDNAFSYLR